MRHLHTLKLEAADEELAEQQHLYDADYERPRFVQTGDRAWQQLAPDSAIIGEATTRSLVEVSRTDDRVQLRDVQTGACITLDGCRLSTSSATASESSSNAGFWNRPVYGQWSDGKLSFAPLSCTSYWVCVEKALAGGTHAADGSDAEAISGLREIFEVLSDDDEWLTLRDDRCGAFYRLRKGIDTALESSANKDGPWARLHFCGQWSQEDGVLCWHASSPSAACFRARPGGVLAHIEHTI